MFVPFGKWTTAIRRRMITKPTNWDIKADGAGW